MPEGAFTPAPAYPAATVILVRDGEGGLEVFMVRRDQKTRFMAGAYVFPGGRLDEADAAADADAWCTGIDAARERLADLDRPGAIAYLVAAVREMFEEAGILLAHDRSGSIVSMIDEGEARYSEHRAAVHRGERSLRDVIVSEGLVVPADALVCFAHWVTPEVETRRFDTRFFMTRAPERQLAAHDASETVASFWISPREALRSFEREEIVLGPPTWQTLKDLARVPDAAGALEWASTRPIHRTQPRFAREGDTKMLILPGDPLYPAGPAPAFTDETRFVLQDGVWRARRAF
jgi:8-oxo-dGTP pyrophosphatase MutT (NUDIX family)